MMSYLIPRTAGQQLRNLRTQHVPSASPRIAIYRRNAGQLLHPFSSSANPSSSRVPFNWEDPLNTADLYSEDELAIQDTARQYCQERLLPRILGIFCFIPSFVFPPKLFLPLLYLSQKLKNGFSNSFENCNQRPTETKIMTKPFLVRWVKLDS